MDPLRIIQADTGGMAFLAAGVDCLFAGEGAWVDDRACKSVAAAVDVACGFWEWVIVDMTAIPALLL